MKDKKPSSRSGHEKGNNPAVRKGPVGKIMSFFYATAVIGAATVILSLLYLRSQALPAVQIVQTSQIYDIQGHLIDSTHAGQNRHVVSLKDISPYLIQATLAIEDHRFYSHFGVDPKGMLRAIWTNLHTMSKQQGASTITQQLARNLYLNHDRTWGRKIKEAVYAIQLELQWSKDQILERYLNQIYFGFSTYGVEAAAQMYFGKSAGELSLAESAMLAGIPKGPKYYSPYFDMDNAVKRQHLILEAMVRHHFITEEEKNQALRERLVIQPPEKDSPAAAPYFRDYVRNVAARLGISEETFDGGGIKVYTTLDLEAQKIAEETVNKYLKDYPDLQAALVSIDPRTGYIKAMVGGRNYGESQFNRAVMGKRQPGSSFKPIVYLAALQNGFTPVTRIVSEPTTFTYDNGRKTYTPNNFGGNYFGPIDMREAIAKSDNVFAVTALMQTGADKVIQLAKRLGIESPLEPLPSMALGTFPVSPLEMASAFGVIANQGIRIEPTAILRIEDAGGKVLYEAHPRSERILQASYTYVLTNMMESVFDRGGTGSRVANTLKRPAAGKTGTTDTDAWMVGFTPELATAVWIGYDRGRKISPAESHLATPIFAEYTESALQSIPPKLFPIPNGVVSVYIDPATGKLAHGECPEPRLETFIAGTEPKEYCTEHGEAVKGWEENENGRGSNINRSWWEDLKRWWNE